MVTIVAILAVGCKGVDDDVEPAPTLKTVVFEGKVDSAYAGDWVAVGGLSRLNLKPDGAALIEATTNSAAGKSTSHLQGKWLAQEGNLLVQYGDASHDTTTLKYVATLSGNKLTLQQPGGRLKTIYVKK